MGINSAEKERLEKLDNISLVEHLLTLQQQCVDLFNNREKNRNFPDIWERYHNEYYEKTSELIEVKYMIVARMNKGELYDDLKKNVFGGK